MGVGALIHAAANFASFFAFRGLSINASTFWRMVWQSQRLFRNVARNAAILANHRLWGARRRSPRQKRPLPVRWGLERGHRYTGRGGEAAQTSCPSPPRPGGVSKRADALGRRARRIRPCDVPALEGTGHLPPLLWAVSVRACLRAGCASRRVVTGPVTSVSAAQQ